MLVIHNINQPVSPSVVQALFFTTMEEIIQNFTYKGRLGRDLLDEGDIGKIFCTDNPEVGRPRVYYLVVDTYPESGTNNMVLLTLTDIHNVNRNKYIEMYKANPKKALEEMQYYKETLRTTGTLFVHKYFSTFYFYEPLPVSNARRIGKYKIVRR